MGTDVVGDVTPQTSSPAEQLLGRSLEGGWVIAQRVARTAGATGGRFSHGYIAESPAGQRAYLKALDYSEALRSPDPARALQGMTEAYNFERELCTKCRDRRLSRVVRAIADGSIMVDPRNPATVVQYLIFELASGDVRSQLDAADQFDTAWALRSLHQIANGLKQLHGLGIAHQDLKPSNVLSFPDDGSKIADLGRSACKELTSPYDDHKVAGDRSYAPPELLYGHIDGDWTRRRIGCDAYLLGSMVVFLFHRVAMTTLILDNMERSHHWRAWDGTFEEVLPYLRDAFGYALRDIGPAFPPYLRDELTCIARELCEPDPRLRGHPANRTTRQNQYSLERYVSRFNLLASKVELGLLQR